MDQGPGDAVADIYSRLDAARLEFDAQARRFEEIRARLQATIDGVHRGRPQREILHQSVFARLQAKLETMPVIEQAKGVLMAQYGCGPEEAFDLLRRTSQSANVKVSVLAEHIVEQVAAHKPDAGPRSIATADRKEGAGGPPRSIVGARPAEGCRLATA